MVTNYKYHIYPSQIHSFDVSIAIVIYFRLAHIYVSSYEPKDIQTEIKHLLMMSCHSPEIWSEGELHPEELNLIVFGRELFSNE